MVGQEGEVRLRVTNLSPDLIARARIDYVGDITQPYVGPPRDVFEYLGISFAQNCPNVAECNRFGQICYEVGNIPAGESRSCYARIRAIQKRDVPFKADFVTYHFENAAIDPNSSNNLTTLIYAIKASPLSVPPITLDWKPVSFSAHGLWLSTLAQQISTMKTQLLLCSLLLSFQAFSQTQPEIDLQLTFESDPLMPWVVGQEGEVRLRVTNLSTKLAARARINFVGDFTVPYVGPPRDEFRNLGIGFTQNCPNVTECNRFGQICYEVGNIPAGESRFCYARIRAFRKRDIPFTSQYIAYHFENAAIDPNEANNLTTLTLAIAEVPLSIPLSPWAKSLLVLALMAFGSVHLRNR